MVARDRASVGRADVGERDSGWRLLPSGSRLGWTPYVWLIYLVTFFIEPVARSRAGQAGLLYWTATLLGLGVFLVAYFRGHWVRGVRLLPIVIIQTLLGIAFSPINFGASVFFVYAGSFAGRIDRPRLAIRLILGIVTIGFITGWFVGAPPFYFITTAVTLLIGGVGIHTAQAADAEAELRLAHDEIRHLAAVAERERIARDLHDVLGHTLSLIALKSELASRLVARDPERAAREMGDVEDAARSTLREVREAIRGYHPTVAEEGERARAMLKAAGIDPHIDLGDHALVPGVEETLALTLREGVTNVVRHSGASACWVSLELHHGEMSLEIRDDGRGTHAPAGAGLTGMRERVEAFRGSVVLEISRGLILRVSIPTAAAVEASTP